MKGKQGVFLAILLGMGVLFYSRVGVADQPEFVLEENMYLVLQEYESVKKARSSEKTPDSEAGKKLQKDANLWLEEARGDAQKAREILNNKDSDPRDAERLIREAEGKMQLSKMFWVDSYYAKDKDDPKKEKAGAQERKARREALFAKMRERNEPIIRDSENERQSPEEGDKPEAKATGDKSASTETTTPAKSGLSREDAEAQERKARREALFAKMREKNEAIIRENEGQSPEKGDNSEARATENKSAEAESGGAREVFIRTKEEGEEIVRREEALREEMARQYYEAIEKGLADGTLERCEDYEGHKYLRLTARGEKVREEQRKARERELAVSRAEWESEIATEMEQKLKGMDLEEMEAELEALAEEERQVQAEASEMQAEVAGAGSGAMAMVSFEAGAALDVIYARMEGVRAVIEAKKRELAGASNIPEKGALSKDGFLSVPEDERQTENKPAEVTKLSDGTVVTTYTDRRREVQRTDGTTEVWLPDGTTFFRGQETPKKDDGVVYWPKDRDIPKDDGVVRLDLSFWGVPTAINDELQKILRRQSQESASMATDSIFNSNISYLSPGDKARLKGASVPSVPSIQSATLESLKDQNRWLMTVEEDPIRSIAGYDPLQPGSKMAQTLSDQLNSTSTSTSTSMPIPIDDMPPP